MSEEKISGAEPIPQTGEAAWFPPVEDDAEALIHQQPQPRNLRWVFYGNDGLRAGWSILLFLLLVFLLVVAARPILHSLIPMPKHMVETPAKFALIGDGISFAAVALAAFVVSLVEKRRFRSYGLGSLKGRLGQFAAGSVLGFLLLSLLVFVLKLNQLLVFNGRLLFGADAWKWGALWALAFLAVGLAEEYATRAFMQFTLARGLAGIAGALGLSNRRSRVLGFWLTALLFSFVFGFGHKSNNGESPIGLLSAGLIGLVFTFSLWRTGSLWWAVGFHAAWDWAQSFLYGVADSGNMMQNHLLASHPQGAPLFSGGLTGPEGSIYVVAIILLIALLIAATLPSEPGSPSDPAYSPNDDRRDARAY